jgi:uncharacterized membrane protein
MPTAPLPDPIAQNIDAIVELQTKAQRNLPRHHRVVESVTAFFSRPAFLYGILIMAILWVLPNVLPRRFGSQPFDPPPFYALQGIVSFSALLITTGVLIKQTRQEQLAEQRAQLSLQMNLLAEQKITKLIELVEELRRDLPDVQDRHDPESEVMQQPIDPHLIVNILEERLEEELTELKTQENSNASTHKDSSTKSGLI